LGDVNKYKLEKIAPRIKKRKSIQQGNVRLVLYTNMGCNRIQYSTALRFLV
jgi:hypothetical protein